MDQTEYKIKLPTLPEGCDITDGIAQIGDKVAYWRAGSWKWEDPAIGHSYPFIARRRQSLADWANGQRLFQALAQMAKDYDGRELTIETQATLEHGQWTIEEGLHWPNMGPAPFHGKLRLEGGKWVDA